MTPVYEPWDEARGAEIIAEHDKLEGATLASFTHCRRRSATCRSPQFR